MAEPGGGLAAPPSPPPPPPPPPPPQPPPPQTKTTGTDMAKRHGAGALTEEQTAGLPPPGQPSVHTEAPGAGAQPPGAPSQKSAVATEEENQLPPPPPSQQEQQQDDSSKDGEDSATIKPRQARWPRIRPPVLWLLSLFRQRRQSQPIEQPKIPPPPPEDGAGGGPVPDKVATEKDEGEGSKSRPHEAEAPPTSASGEKAEVAGGAIDAGWPRMKKKLQNKVNLVMKTMSWYRRHRSPKKEDGPVDEPAAQKIVEATKPPPSPAPRWEKEGEERLERILEEILEKACTRLVAGEYRKLRDDKKQCLLTFSIFPLGEDVKKQAVTYWWATQFGQFTEKLKDADGVFTELSDDGFLEPIKNRCSGVIHGCRVNPLVHWMVKHEARETDFADLEKRGNPKDVQDKSTIFCVTADNRVKLQKLRERDESQLQAQAKSAGTKKTSEEPSQGKADAGRSKEDQKHQKDLIAQFEKKKVIVNIDAHVYRLPELVLSKFPDRLVVLQLGRWGNSDDKTYREVGALEYIAKLKNLRYLSLRGLSQLTELPREFKKLHRVEILDLRGCQNLVRLSASAVENLTSLTHLDLTECYMLEYIGRAITALSQLQVFKGFVFGVGVQRRKSCRLKDLEKLKKLRKLGINITTDTTVNEGEMSQLKSLRSLRLLTVTWGEWPSIFGPSDGQEKDERLKKLLDNWTGLMLPPDLEKLDVRCYPRKVLPRKWLEGHEKLTKLYVRGGVVEKLYEGDPPSKNKIETLRLRYLNKFNMSWEELFRMLNKNTIKHVEVVDNDKKVMMNQTKGKVGMVKDDQMEEMGTIKTRMNVPGSTLDEKGVWILDEKEKYNKAPGDMVREGDGPASGAQAVKGGGGGSPAGTMAEEGGDTAEGEKKRASSAAAIDQSAPPAISGDAEGAGTNENGIDKSGGPVKASQQAPPMASKEDAPKTEAATGATDTPKVSDKGGKGDDGGDINGAAEAEDDPATEEDIGDGGEVKNADGGEVKNAAQTEGEGEDKDEGQERRREVRDTMDEQSTIGEDGGNDDTSSPAAQRPELKEETTPANLIPAAKASASRTTTLPAPPASTGPAPAPVAGEAAAKPKEPGKAGDDDGLAAAAGATESTDTITSTSATA